MQWVAYYNDDTHLRQYDDAGKENKYADIDRTRLSSFALYDGGRPDEHYETATRKILHLHLDNDQRLIYRRRVERSVGSDAPIVCYLVGWQQTIEGRNVQSIAYVFEDGTVEVAGRWRDGGHPWFYSVAPVPSEEVIEKEN